MSFGVLRGVNVVNPVMVYVGVWGSVLALYLLGLTKNIVPVSFVGVFLILLNMASMVTLYLLVVAGKPKPECPPPREHSYLRACQYYAAVLGLGWVIGTLFEIVVMRGFPLLWTLIGDPRLYVDFGIPSFHGIMNAFYLQLMTALGYLYVKQKKVWIACLVCLLLLWPVMMLGRGILLSAVIQLVAVFLMMHRTTVKSLAWMVVICAAAVLAFGILGDLRQQANPLAYLVKPEYEGVFASLPNGFLWFYVYMTSGMSNLFFNIDTLEPVFSFSYSFYNLLPSAIKGMLNMESRSDLFQWVDPNLNAATYYAGYVADFGPLGAFCLASVIQLCACVTYSIGTQGRPWGILAYSVMLQILVFTIFYDMFFLLPVLFQLLLAFLLFVAFHLSRELTARRKVRLTQTFEAGIHDD